MGMTAFPERISLPESMEAKTDGQTGRNHLYRFTSWEYCWAMGETAISVSEAAKDFLALLERVERKGEPAILLREGKRVATLSPLPNAALTCAELAERWPSLPKLPPDEARAFADDIENATRPPLKSAWD